MKKAVSTNLAKELKYKSNIDMREENVKINATVKTSRKCIYVKIGKTDI